jgi:hypothetical protein
VPILFAFCAEETKREIWVFDKSLDESFFEARNFDRHPMKASPRAFAGPSSSSNAAFSLLAAVPIPFAFCAREAKGEIGFSTNHSMNLFSRRGTSLAVR